jgi:hypothetical protein
MRMPMNTISLLTLFWCIIYVLAFFSVSIAGILAAGRNSKKAPAKKTIRNMHGCKPWNE